LFQLLDCLEEAIDKKNEAKNILIFNILVLMLLGCSLSKPLPDFPFSQSREPYEGFQWKIVESYGMKF